MSMRVDDILSPIRVNVYYVEREIPTEIFPMAISWHRVFRRAVMSAQRAARKNPEGVRIYSLEDINGQRVSRTWNAAGEEQSYTILG